MINKKQGSAMRYYLKFIFTICAFNFLLSPLSARESDDFILVIDPGHGGKDYGAPGSKAKEKNINLDVALLFGELVSAKYPDVKVIYTRKTDKFVDLKERSDLANREKADLFMSIHANATVSRTPYGAETYTLGLARTDDNLEVAKRENSVILLEDNYKRKYEGFDPRSSESYIIFEFIQNKYMEQSVGFASMIQNELKKSSKRSDRGVRQAGFLVLRETSMPSVLVELGFISNPTEEAYMTSALGQQSLANSLFNAFAQFKTEHDRKMGAHYYASQQPETTKTVPKTTAVPVPAKTEPKQTTAAPVVSKTSAVEPKTTQLAASTPTTTPPPAVSQATNAKQGEVVYKVQILTSPTPLTPNAPQLKGYKASSYVDTDGLYKYTYGSTTNADEISQLKATLKKDFPDAFTVRFVNGVRVR